MLLAMAAKHRQLLDTIFRVLDAHSELLRLRFPLFDTIVSRFTSFQEPRFWRQSHRDHMQVAWLWLSIPDLRRTRRLLVCNIGLPELNWPWRLNIATCSSMFSGVGGSLRLRLPLFVVILGCSTSIQEPRYWRCYRLTVNIEYSLAWPGYGVISSLGAKKKQLLHSGL